MSNNYKRLQDGSYGAWIDTGYGRKSTPKPVVGDEVEILTKAGEIHVRTVKSIVKEYASGCVVSLVYDAEVDKTAQARYAAKVEDSRAAVGRGHYTKTKTEPMKGFWRTPEGGALCWKCDSYCYGDCDC